MSRRFRRRIPMAFSHSWRPWFLATPLIACLCVAAPGGRAHAQTIRGSITGTVTDETGASLAAVTVTVTHVETGIETTAVTTTQGSYTLPLLASGTYQATVSQQGFKK